MTGRKNRICATLLLSCVLPILAQQSPGSTDKPTIPRLVNFGGVLTDAEGKPLVGQVGVTFSLYKGQLDNTPLWRETQNVEADKSGHYAVTLGSTSSDGLPSGIFVGGDARWLGVEPEGQPEQSRVLLLSVPYALKAGDADTLGGLPASAFLSSASRGAPSSGSPAAPDIAVAAVPGAPPPAGVGGSGATDFVPLWTSSTNLGNSILFQSGGTMQVNGGFEFPALGTATATAGKNSQPLEQAASAFDSSTGKAVAEAFQWQAEPAGNDTASPSATLNLLFGSDGATPKETGLKIDHQGLLTFAAGQTFPGGKITGSETINGNLSATNLTASSGIQAQFGSFTGSNTGDILIAQNQNTSGGIGVVGNAVGTTGIGMEGNAFGSGGTGVQGSASGSSGIGLQGNATGNNGIGVQGKGATGITGTASFPNGIGVEGIGGNGKGGIEFSIGVEGISGGIGVSGVGNLTAGSGGIGVSGSGASIGVSGSSGNNGTGVQGKGATGVSGNGTGLGVAAIATGTGSQGVFAAGQHQGLAAFADASSGNHQGVFAQAFSPTGTGTLSMAVGESKTGQSLIGCCAVGVWGDTNQTSSGAAAIVGTADDAQALFLQNNSTTHLTANINNPAAGAGVEILNVAGRDGSCSIDGFGNLECGGELFGENLNVKNNAVITNLFVTGHKSGVATLDNGHKVALYAVEAPENWFEDYGGGRLENGVATITIEPTFFQTVNTNLEYRVFLTPKGDCEGLYVTNKGPQGFEVHELRGGRSNVEFDYRIIARRKGFENLRLGDVTEEIRAAQNRKPVRSNAR
ncbi:MAG: hypothetical protein JOY62_06305 [Acidobacteriaceae bacterium]|nr:hypothetical protein [Acidobacteriaceae bacterium]MBV9779570.1 hypothetical protein [Acidobacteriaceae bacterium]